MRQGGSAERPAIFFDDAEDFRAWLEAQPRERHRAVDGPAQEARRRPRAQWAEAVREALCFGWIDSMSQRIDEDAVRQRWTPRKPGSNWSTVNIDAVAELTAAGRMRPAGLAAFARRREDRSGVYAYENRERTWSDRLRGDAARRRSARRPSGTAATPSYRKVATNWVLTAKQEATRDKRMAELVEDCANLRLIKTQRYGTEPAWVRRMQAELG